MSPEAAALIEFAGAGAPLTILPGLDTALVIRTAAVEGRRHALVAGLGICAGILIWGLATATGLGALFAASQLAYGILRIAGAAYLLYLGGVLLLKAPVAQPGRAVAAGTSGYAAGAFRRGLLTNLLNPKVGVFYVSFLPQFVPATVSVTAFSLLLASIHAAEGFLWFLILTGATRLMARWLARGPLQAAISRITGAVFIAVGLKLALSRR